METNSQENLKYSIKWAENVWNHCKNTKRDSLVDSCPDSPERGCKHTDVTGGAAGWSGPFITPQNVPFKQEWCLFMPQRERKDSIATLTAQNERENELYKEWQS